MELNTLEHKRMLKVTLKGSLDSLSAEDMYSYVQSKLNQGYRRFLFLVSDVSHLESGGISLLLRLRDTFSKERAACVYSGWNSECLALLKLFGLDDKILYRQNQSEAEVLLSGLEVSEPEKLKKPERRVQYSMADTPNAKPIQFYSEPAKIQPRPVEWKEDIVEKISLPETTPSEWSPLQTFESKIEKARQKESEIPSLETEPDTESLAGRFRIKDESEDGTKKSETSGSVTNDWKLPDAEDKIFLRKGAAESSSSQKEYKKLSPQEMVQGQVVKPAPVRQEIYCEACGVQLRVSVPGKYKCPNCSTVFFYTEMGSARFLEKLVG